MYGDALNVVRRAEFWSDKRRRQLFENDRVHRAVVLCLILDLWWTLADFGKRGLAH